MTILEMAKILLIKLVMKMSVYWFLKTTSFMIYILKYEIKELSSQNDSYKNLNMGVI